ncbi:hypothetical protein CLV30_12475 [Haloactinopolyspora alba]|uniref:Uncharacterized protein n=1 Tax=Haloactinopolyspora alba TaxID=648780 RepID=A0A2P8DIE1_9ACTN|nr:DUF5946 family protein [Haloactinopolyspora alba]PSK96987.1 hypothetical protein CLV30_12475 [Haloactinopolyspora alba]
MTSACPQCGGPGGTDRCRALFDQLLALEFGRGEPWGPLHGVTVPAFALQHPGRFAATDPNAWLTSLHVYVTHGLESASRMWTGAAGRGLPVVAGLPPVARMPHPFTVTIADVAGPDRDFPADGHADRVDRWVRDIYGCLVDRKS